MRGGDIFLTWVNPRFHPLLLFLTHRAVLLLFLTHWTVLRSLTLYVMYSSHVLSMSFCRYNFLLFLCREVCFLYCFFHCFLVWDDSDLFVSPFSLPQFHGLFFILFFFLSMKERGWNNTRNHRRHEKDDSRRRLFVTVLDPLFSVRGNHCWFITCHSQRLDLIVLFDQDMPFSSL